MIRAVVARTLAVLLVAAAWSPRPVRADAVVGTGMSSSCTEAALDAALGCGAPNGSPPTSNCTGGGNITFNCGPRQVTITVTSTKTISADTTIDGGSLITISGGNSVGVFWVNSGLTVENLTIAYGNSAGVGGGIYNYYGGTLTVTNTTFDHNSAAGFYGGGIYNYNSGPLTVTNSTFSYNSARGYGGAIYNSGPLTVTNSTFSGNGATSDGGGIGNNSGALTVTNSTFSGNGAGSYGGAIWSGNYSSVTVTNSTFSGNSAGVGGGIYNYYGSAPGYPGGTLTVTNTIVANSTSGGNCAVYAGTVITDGGNNIDDGTTCGFSTANASLSNTDAKLDPLGLRNNGGPTQTIALQAGSPAVNAGNESVCAVLPVNNLDQRDFVRPGAGAANCSIGAYEYTSRASLDCCQCPTSCAAPINGSCGQCVAVFGASCVGEALCVLHTATPTAPTRTPTRTPTPTPITPSPTPTATATNTPGTSDCCQCATFCAAPIAGTCGGCALVFGASCTDGVQCISRTPTTTPCVGDCDGSGQVTVNEIIVLVNIALGSAEPTACAAGIPSGSQVNVALIIQAVNNALNGCPKT